MPSNLVRTIAKKCGKTPAAVEKIWSEVEAELLKSGAKKSEKDFYAKLVGRVKFRLSHSCLDKLGWTVARKKPTAESTLTARQLRRRLELLTDEPDDELGWDAPDEKEARERAIQDFHRKYPKLTRQLKQAVKTNNVGFLLKQLLRGTFWGAATVSNPILVGGGLLINQLIKRSKRQKALKKYLQARGVASDLEDEE